VSKENRQITQELTDSFLDKIWYDGLEDLTVGRQAWISVDLDEPYLQSRTGFKR